MDVELLRKKLNFTQKEMADFLGVSFSTYQRYKNHPNKIPDTVKELVRLKMTYEHGTLGNLIKAIEEHFRINQRFDLLVEQVDTLRLMIKDRDKEILDLQNRKNKTV